MKYDFSGYATKNDLKCTDGRIIRKDAFKHQDGEVVPLVWQHLHNDPTNVLGHALLENVSDGVIAHCLFNNSEKAKQARELVRHGDVKSLSIFANQLQQRGSDVLHGSIKEVSLVLAGANPGATITNLTIEHADGSYTDSEDEAFITTMNPITIDDVTHAAEGGSGKTIGDIFDTLNEEQKNVVYAMLAMAAGESDSMKQSDEGGTSMKYNIFDGDGKKEDGKNVLSHSQIQEIFADAQKCGSLKESFLSHVQNYGIENIDILFPDAKKVRNEPDLISRDMGWVRGVLNGTHHVPFSRIKSTAADITADEARAKGYIKGKLKKEEVIKLLKRVTTPTTIYKKQKLDRDDILDITDLNVVSWLKSEMRLMLDEELARAILVGDGREPDDDDKINEENIRPIFNDDDLYAHHVDVGAETTTEDKIDMIIRAKKHYKGSGSPAYYTTTDEVTDMLLLKDKLGRRLFASRTELAATLGVSEIIEVPVMEGVVRTDSSENKFDLLGIMVNLKDYTVGADKGGQVSMFDDFDIDYNQYKYLMETRCSACLTKPKSAVVIEKKQNPM